MSSRNVIVFGPTGAVGSITALSAHQAGARVTLAMRDPSKPIPALQNLPIPRVHADLTKPSTLAYAIQSSGARHAFLYIVPGTTDSLKTALITLKSSGIQTIVLLSSFSIENDIHAISRTDFVPYRHAQAEISLMNVFGTNGIAVRPAYFATNALQMRNGVLSGEVRLPNPDAVLDWIVPADVGRVCGCILARGSIGHERVVSLVGAQLMSLRQVVEAICFVVGVDVKVRRIRVEEAVDDVRSMAGLTEAFARWYVDNMMGVRRDISLAPAYKEAVGNIWRYTGRKPITFQEWLGENRKLFEIV
ncbi:hypothetical protein N7478_007542 [Penicillium angulare]|uniref:uncharacterized protein n=1 Tax=Penicillium angulare TaxID=116970 RepID=UPI002541772A|nr:uncharacterized protein N7478_007542 [Penicillium angulare]KAJ5272417.1 hypothetical protein N7478_007542 [Penicillium angulare]